MTDRPIIFSAPMVRALLDDRCWVYSIPVTSVGLTVWRRNPEYAVGDRLWVKEIWGLNAGAGVYCCEDDLPNFAHGPGAGFSPVVHQAGKETYAWGMYGPPAWRAPDEMQRRSSRLTLIVDDVIEPKGLVPDMQIMGKGNRLALEGPFVGRIVVSFKTIRANIDTAEAQAAE